MNDIMSFGIHRLWKENFINWMNPHPDSKLIDVASGTGDIAKLFSKRNNNSSEITCVEPNYEMFEEGKKNLKELPITKSKTKEEAKQTLCQFHNKVNDDLGKPTFNCNTWSF